MAKIIGVENFFVGINKFTANASSGDTAATGTAQASQIIDTGLTANTVPYANGSKQLTSSAVTPTELGYLSGVTSSIQTQLAAFITRTSADQGANRLQNKDFSADNDKFVDPTDTTKKLAFSLSSMTTGKTLTLAGQQSTDQTLSFPNITGADTVAVASLAQTLLAKTLSGSSILTDALIKDVSDSTKQIQFSTSGNTTGKKLTLAGTQSTDQTLSFPNITGADTLVALSLAQTLLAKTLSGASILTDALFKDVSDNTKQLQISTSGNTTGKKLTLSSSQSTDQIMILPNVTTTDTLASLGLAQTFTGAKTFSATLTVSLAGGSTAPLQVTNTSGRAAIFTSDDSATTTGTALSVRLKNSNATTNNFNLIQFHDAGNAATGAISMQTIDQTNHYGTYYVTTRQADGFLDRLTISTTVNSLVAHLFANGTAAAPSIGWTADADGSGTGFFRPTADALGFSTAGTERARIDANGDLTINTDKFTVANSTGNTTVAGTLAVSNNISITKASDPKLDITASTGTNRVLGIRMTNTGGLSTIGLESSAGNTINTGGTAYALAMQAGSGRVIEFGYGNGAGVALRIETTNATSVLGTLGVAGISTLAGAAFTDAGAGTFTGASRARILNSGGQTFIDTLGANTSTYGTYTIRQLSSDVSLNRTVMSVDVNGAFGIGEAAAAGHALIVGTGTLTGTTQRGIRSDLAATTAATANITGFYSTPNSGASGNTSQIMNYHAANVANTGTHTTTTAYGYYADQISSGGTNNYGFYSNQSATDTGSFAFFGAGSAKSRFGGGLDVLGTVGETGGSITGFKAAFTGNTNNTSNIVAFLAANTTAASTTVVRTINFESDQPTKGAGGTLNNHIDFLGGGASGHIATNNASFSDTTAISGNTFLFQAGSDPSILTGQLSLGTTTANQFLTVNGGGNRTPISFKGNTGASAGFLYYDGSSSGIKTEAGSFGASTQFIGVDTTNGVVGYTNNALRFQVSTGGLFLLKQTAGAAEAATLNLEEKDTTPSNPASGAECKVYMKADKLVIQYNDAGTVRYKYLDLTGTGVTWTHTTSAP